MPTEGNSVKGTFIFEQLPDGVKVSAVLTGQGQINVMVFILSMG